MAKDPRIPWAAVKEIGMFPPSQESVLSEHMLK
jgi:hypothetical protein